MHVIIAGKTHRLSMHGDARFVHKSHRNVSYGELGVPYISASLKGPSDEPHYSAELRIRFGELLKLVKALSVGADNELHMCQRFLEENELEETFKEYKQKKAEAEARSVPTPLVDKAAAI
jgi:hypothetical protein